ncbi:DUF1622 domain-containing protein [Chromobacterium haemolyticum]|nr:DUF1622 domain-containing protein [Chromobacterium haemolyticum]
MGVEHCALAQAGRGSAGRFGDRRGHLDLGPARYLRRCFSSSHDDYNQVRLSFARFLALALELQLAADILSTAVAPSWDQIGKLGAIAVLRTALNYFLGKEIRETEAARRPNEPPAV